MHACPLPPAQVPTVTASPTITAEIPTCSGGQSRTAGNGGTVALTGAGSRCLQPVSMGGGGSSTTLSGSLVIRIINLQGSLIVQLDSGCKTTGGTCPACAACQRSYTTADQVLIPRGPTAVCAPTVCPNPPPPGPQKFQIIKPPPLCLGTEHTEQSRPVASP